MVTTCLRGQLDELFGTESERRAETVRIGLRETLDRARPRLIYGSGRNGRMTARALRSAGLPFSGFLDDTPSKQGSTVDGYPVWSPAEARGLHDGDPLVLVALFTPGHSFRETRRRLLEMGYHSVLSMFAVASCLPEELLPFYFFDRPEVVLAAHDEYQRLFDDLTDERSQEELVRHLRFRLYVDTDALLGPVGLNYGYFAGRLPDDVGFIDGGAFDGDSLQEFFQLAGRRFARALAFEPDAMNFAKLSVYRANLPDAIRQRVELHNAGLWSESKRLRFDATGTLGSSVGEERGEEVSFVALDDVVRPASALFIKYDVEGAEYEALCGARRLLQKGNAALAVAAYHRPDDLWSLAALIREINPRYRFGLRSHMDDGADLMLYAVPPN